MQARVVTAVNLGWGWGSTKETMASSYLCKFYKQNSLMRWYLIMSNFSF